MTKKEVNHKQDLAFRKAVIDHRGERCGGYCHICTSARRAATEYRVAKLALQAVANRPVGCLVNGEHDFDCDCYEKALHLTFRDAGIEVDDE